MRTDEPVHYAREAFLHPVNLGMLFVATLTAFFVNDVPMVPNLILSMAFGGELMYLGIAPRMSGFQRYIRERRQRQLGPMEQERRLFESLGERSQKKFLVLRHLADNVRENYEKLDHGRGGLARTIHERIQTLLHNYIRLLDLHRRYLIYLSPGVEEGILQEIHHVKEEMEGVESQALRETKARRVQILEKRRERFHSAKEKFLVCETQIETIEDAVQYIYEQSMTISSAEELGEQLDTLLGEVEETTSILSDLESGISSPPRTDHLDEKLEQAIRNQESGGADGARSAVTASNRPSKPLNTR